MNNLTTIASIPQGGGCASKLPAEVGKEHELEIGIPIRWITLEEAKKMFSSPEDVQMRSAYFQEQLDEETPLVWPAIDLGVFGGDA